MIKFLFSRKFLALGLIISIALLISYRGYGIKYVDDWFVKAWLWFIGGDYSGYAVLSTAFAINTWGVAVRTLRRKVQTQCRQHVKDVLARLSQAVVLSGGNKGVLEFAWRERRNPRVRHRVEKLMSTIEHYKNMLPSIFDISMRTVSIVMVLFAAVSVICLIKEVNGRFSAFLLLPYPAFWLYSKIASMWIWFRLNFCLYLVLRLTPTNRDDEEIEILRGNLRKMALMFNQLSTPKSMERPT